MSDMGVSAGSTMLAVGGNVLGLTAGLLMRIPKTREPMTARALIPAAMAGLGVATFLRVGPTWLALAGMLGAVAFLVTVGVRRLVELRSLRASRPRLSSSSEAGPASRLPKRSQPKPASRGAAAPVSRERVGRRPNAKPSTEPTPRKTSGRWLRPGSRKRISPPVPPGTGA